MFGLNVSAIGLPDSFKSAEITGDSGKPDEVDPVLKYDLTLGSLLFVGGVCSLLPALISVVFSGIKSQYIFDIILQHDHMASEFSLSPSPLFCLLSSSASLSRSLSTGEL